MAKKNVVLTALQKIATQTEKPPQISRTRDILWRTPRGAAMKMACVRALAGRNLLKNVFFRPFQNVLDAADVLPAQFAENQTKQATQLPGLPAVPGTPPVVSNRIAGFPIQSAPVVGGGPAPTGLDGPNDTRAAALPGTPGHSATNVIDQRGGLDPRHQTVDGNNAAGVQKGFNIG